MNDGGPAFPQYFNVIPEMRGDTHIWHGMSLRDWFAGMAMSNLCTAGMYDGKLKPTHIADWSYQIADAMLVEREKQS